MAAPPCFNNHRATLCSDTGTTGKKRESFLSLRVFHRLLARNSVKRTRCAELGPLVQVHHHEELWLSGYVPAEWRLALIRIVTKPLCDSR